ncbi:hypothetical protein DYB36_011012, partial [Aphanomyces astaci]
CHLPLSASVRDDLLEIAGGAWKGLVENAIASEVYPIDKIVRNRTTGRCATVQYTPHLNAIRKATPSLLC